MLYLYLIVFWLISRKEKKMIFTSRLEFNDRAYNITIPKAVIMTESDKNFNTKFFNNIFSTDKFIVKRKLHILLISRKDYYEKKIINILASTLLYRIIFTVYVQ